MKSTKSIIATLLVLNMLFIGFPKITMADTKECYAQYSGSTTASWGYKPDCTFTITKIAGNKFKGTFSAQNIGKYSFSESISGTVTKGSESFTCYFKVFFYNNMYYSNIIATVYPYEGKCECFCEGSWHLVDFIMTGTKFSNN